MLNKAVLSFEAGKLNKVKYGKWHTFQGKLYFNWWLIAEFIDGGVVCYERRLTECGHEYPTYHAIDKVIKYLKK